MNIKLVAFSALAGALFAGAASAAPVYSVQVWTGNPAGNVLASTQADLANKPTSNASATFLYSGAINWTENASSNSFGAFLNLASISSFASPRGTYADVAAFGTANMSVSGDSNSSYFLISGNYDAGSSTFAGSVAHDDGASLYVDGAAVFAFPNETSVVTDSFTLPAGSHSFQLAYVEGNGTPSVLQITFPDAVTVPEPMSLALLGSGLLGAGMIRRKRA